MTITMTIRTCAASNAVMSDAQLRLKSVQALLLVGLQNDRKEQTATIEKLRKDRDDSRSEADDAHRDAISIFNEQKKCESHIQRLQSEVHR